MAHALPFNSTLSGEEVVEVVSITAKTDAELISSKVADME